MYFKLFVVHNDISHSDQEKLQLTIKPFSHFASLSFIHAGEYLKDIWEKLPDKHHFAYEMFYKLIAPSLFPQYDKIIISDVDVVFLGDVKKEFLEFDCDENHLLAGVVSNDPDAFFPIPSKGYRSGYKRFNAQELKALQYGVDACYLIINLKQWRAHKTQEKAIEYLQNNFHKLVLAEQNVLAIVCANHIKSLGLQYGASNKSWLHLGESWEKLTPKIYTQNEIDEACKNPIQLHFAGANKPWNTPSEPKSEIWFQYLCQTPFLQDYLNTLEQRMFKKFKESRFVYRLLRLIKRKLLKS
ncbi:glycosyltransferase family 8 protein [Helicobacter pametensis]|uniref:glycosyltransferase family 8 protein n=1 Tax=Helicobacter pametensis TaxID=95149 RepID=UPI0004AC66BD|nr:glycosyltransferase [Helicobacter pametensis]